MWVAGKDVAADAEPAVPTASRAPAARVAMSTGILSLPIDLPTDAVFFM
jgi:hypothetical protein